MSPFENISVDFLVTLWWGQIQENGVGTEGSVSDWRRQRPFFKSSRMHAACGVRGSLARESPSCCDWVRGIQDSQARAAVTGLRKRVLRRENSLMRHALRVTRRAVFLFALFTVSAVWSMPATAQPAQPRETPASPEQQAQDVQQLKAKL